MPRIWAKQRSSGRFSRCIESRLLLPLLPLWERTRRALRRLQPHQSYPHPYLCLRTRTHTHTRTLGSSVVAGSLGGTWLSLCFPHHLPLAPLLPHHNLLLFLLLWPLQLQPLRAPPRGRPAVPAPTPLPAASPRSSSCSPPPQQRSGATTCHVTSSRPCSARPSLKPLALP